MSHPHWDPLGRFLKFVEANESGCWIWIGGKQRGYAAFWYGVKLGRGHRWSYEHFVGTIPEGLDLDHLCRVSACVNPLHLEPVTRKVNMHRGFPPFRVHSLKTHCKNGHPFEGYNLVPRPNGGRGCRECGRLAQARYHLRKRKHAA